MELLIMSDEIKLFPIGTFICDQIYPQQAPRQSTLNHQETNAYIQLEKQKNFEQALEDLEGFERIWIIYLFHKNQNWKPKVLPPRGQEKKGVFATRAPHRPNPIGISCVKLKKIEGLKIYISEFDLLQDTPILDIKPYIPYADSFPDSPMGWLEGLKNTSYDIEISAETRLKLDWLYKHHSIDIHGFIQSQLVDEPLNDRRKRIKKVDALLHAYDIAYRTWRIRFSIDEANRYIHVEDIYSGYSRDELDSIEDKYMDKSIHLSFIKRFSN